MLWIFVNYTKQSRFSKSWIISAFESILENAHFCTQQYTAWEHLTIISLL